MSNYIKLRFSTKDEHDQAAQVYGGLLMDRGHVNEYVPEIYVLKEDEAKLRRRLREEGVRFVEVGMGHYSNLPARNPEPEYDPTPQWWPKFLLWLFGALCGGVMSQLVANWLGMK